MDELKQIADQDEKIKCHLTKREKINNILKSATKMNEETKYSSSRSLKNYDF